MENPKLSYLHFFGYHYYVLIFRKNNLGNVDSKFDEGIFLSYLKINKAYRLFIKKEFTYR